MNHLALDEDNFLFPPLPSDLPSSDCPSQRTADCVETAQSLRESYRHVTLEIAEFHAEYRNFQTFTRIDGSEPGYHSMKQSARNSLVHVIRMCLSLVAVKDDFDWVALALQNARATAQLWKTCRHISVELVSLMKAWKAKWLKFNAVREELEKRSDTLCYLRLTMARLNVKICRMKRAAEILRAMNEL
jgi:hypothetical protein